MQADSPRLAEFKKVYAYAGDETCAGCSLCSTVCPLDIDTGVFIRELRAQKAGPVAKKIGGAIAPHFAATLTATRIGLAGADVVHKIVGTSAMQAGARLARDKFGAPLWTPSFPRGNLSRTPAPEGEGIPVLYFESCATRAMGPPRGDDSEDVRVVAARVFARAGYRLIAPEGEDELCCGQPFWSKGLMEAAESKARQLAARLAAPGQKIPVVFDTSPCAMRMQAYSGPDFAPLDLVEFLNREVAPKLNLKPVDETITAHVVCALRKMGLADAFLDLAGKCAKRVIAPVDVKCCGFSGDKGMFTPELNEYALRSLRDSLPPDCKEGYASSRTCEIGLATHSGRRYRSILHLVDQASSF